MVWTDTYKGADKFYDDGIWYLSSGGCLVTSHSIMESITAFILGHTWITNTRREVEGGVGGAKGGGGDRKWWEWAELVEPENVYMQPYKEEVESRGRHGTLKEVINGLLAWGWNNDDSISFF